MLEIVFTTNFKGFAKDEKIALPDREAKYYLNLGVAILKSKCNCGCKKCNESKM